MKYDVKIEDILTVSKKLLSKRSITPKDDGCMQIISDMLVDVGFNCEDLSCGNVANLWSVRAGSCQQNLFVFLGHTDVVPVGNLADWHVDPFLPTEKDGFLYARGACDMKVSIAAMILATRRFYQQYPDAELSTGFLLTSDEEGEAKDGTRYVMQVLKSRGIDINWCLAGEPTSKVNIADTVKIGAKGSLNADMTIYGRQGHIAQPECILNPIHLAAKAISALKALQWKDGDEYFADTNLEFSNVNAGVGAENVVPDKALCQFNLRYSVNTSVSVIKARIEDSLHGLGIEYKINWRHSAQPYFSKPAALVNTCMASIKEVTGKEAKQSVAGGTSDNRFISSNSCEAIELGLNTETAHQVNECVRISDISALCEIYYNVLLGLNKSLLNTKKNNIEQHVGLT